MGFGGITLATLCMYNLCQVRGGFEFHKSVAPVFHILTSWLFTYSNYELYFCVICNIVTLEPYDTHVHTRMSA